MKIENIGFRGAYKHFCVFPLTEKIHAAMEKFPEMDGANSILTYGYLDAQKGLLMEVLALARHEKEGFIFADGNDTVSLRLGMEDVAGLDFYTVDDAVLADVYAVKLERLKCYDVPQEVEQTRYFDFLDGCRHPIRVDEIQVHLIREGLNTEVCWTRMTGLGDKCFLAELLEEPKQYFGYHIGDTIAFFLQKTDENQVICCSQMTPVLQYTADDLADGSVLKQAIQNFEDDRTENHFYDVLEILRDSLVWILYLDVPGAQNTRIPAFISSGQELFIPVFSSVQEIGEFGEGMIIEQKSFLEALALAAGAFGERMNIVVNPYTGQFVLDKLLLDVVPNLKSSLK